MAALAALGVTAAAGARSIGRPEELGHVTLQMMSAHINFKSQMGGTHNPTVHLRYMNLEKHPGGFLQTLRFDDAEALVEKSTTGVKWVLRKIQKWKVVPVQQPVREEHQLVMAS